MINSPANPKIKNLIKLRQARERREQGLVIVEGHKEIMMALQNGYAVEELYYCLEDQNKTGRPETIPALASFPVGAKVFGRIAMRNNSDGLLALVKAKERNLSDIKPGKQPLLIVLEAVEKPGNLGAILRTADAAGVDGVIVCEEKVDIYNANVIRASLGTVFSVPIAVASNQAALAYLRQHEFEIIAAVPSAKKLYFEADLSRAAAILIGAEHEGLSEFWLANSSVKARIPMQGKVDSLNASVSAALIVYEALRQRLRAI